MSPEYPHPDRYELPEPNDLRRMRLLADLDPEEAGDAVGRSASAIRSYELGESSPRLEDVAGLLEVYAEELPKPRADGGPPAFQEDPHDVIPTEFWYYFRSLRQAMKYMEDDTPEEEKPRCAECGSTWLRFKPGNSGVADPAKHREPGSWKCRACGSHFEEAVAPEADTESDEDRRVKA
jgi:transcriptional regulator with XRE-family HTH domain